MNEENLKMSGKPLCHWMDAEMGDTNKATLGAGLLCLDTVRWYFEFVVDLRPVKDELH